MSQDKTESEGIVDLLQSSQCDSFNSLATICPSSHENSPHEKSCTTEIFSFCDSSQLSQEEEREASDNIDINEVIIEEELSSFLDIPSSSPQKSVVLCSSSIIQAQEEELSHLIPSSSTRSSHSHIKFSSDTIEDEDATHETDNVETPQER